MVVKQTKLATTLSAAAAAAASKDAVQQTQQQHGSIVHSILNQFNDISRRNAVAIGSAPVVEAIKSVTATTTKMPTNIASAVVAAHNNGSGVSRAENTLPMPSLLFGNSSSSKGGSGISGSSGSSSPLNDVLNSLMGLSEEEWRTLRDSMQLFQTTARSPTTTAASHNIPYYISPEDALVGAGGQQTELTEPWLTLLPLIYWLLIILGVVGNVIVILVYAFGRQWRSDLSVYLVNLAVADAMLAIFCLPFTMNQVIEHEWPYSDWMCDLVFYLQLASVLSSVYTLVVIGVDRYMFIIYQKKNRRLSKTTKLLVIIIGWLVTFSICTVQIFVADVHTSVDSRTGRVHRSCSENLGNMNVTYTIAIFLLTYAIPLVVLASAYYMVGRKLSQMMSEVPPDDTSPGTNVSNSNNNWPQSTNNGVVDEPNNVYRGGAATPYLNNSASKQQHLTPTPYSSRPTTAARALGGGAAAALPQRRPLRAEFLRLDPRYNLCRTPEMKRIRQKRRIVRMLVVLVILFAISWLPLHSFFLLFTFCEHWFHTDILTTLSDNNNNNDDSHINSELAMTSPSSQLNAELIQLVFIPSHVLAMSSCCVNPIVYCFMSRRFRNDLVKLWRRATSALAKILKKACCYCCTRDDSDYWSHASSFHVVGAVMDEDDGSYAICTTCKDHQHHHQHPAKVDEHEGGASNTASLMANGGGGGANGQYSTNSSARPMTNGSVSNCGVAGGMERNSSVVMHESSFCDGGGASRQHSPPENGGVNNSSGGNKSSSLHVNNNTVSAEQQPSAQQPDHDLFMASYPLKLSQKDFVKLFSKPIDHKMIRQLSGSINWSHGPISTTGRDAVSDVTDSASKGGYSTFNSGKAAAASAAAGNGESSSAAAATTAEKNPMACFYMCTTCGHLYPVFTNKMPNMSALNLKQAKKRYSKAVAMRGNITNDTQSTASTRLPPIHPSTISHSVSSSSANASARTSAGSKIRPAKHHHHDALLRTSSLTFNNSAEQEGATAALRQKTMTKRDCASCIVNDGGSSLGSSGPSSSVVVAPRVVLERCSSTRVHSGGGGGGGCTTTASDASVGSSSMSNALRPLSQQHLIHPVLLRKQCSACKHRDDTVKKHVKSGASSNNNNNSKAGGNVSSSSTARSNGTVTKPQKSAKELYD